MESLQTLCQNATTYTFQYYCLTRIPYKKITKKETSPKEDASTCARYLQIIELLLITLIVLLILLSGIIDIINISIIKIIVSFLLKSCLFQIKFIPLLSKIQIQLPME